MQDNDVIEYIQYAFELKEQKCYKQAIEMLYKALEKETENCEILFQIGELYYLMNNSQRSIQYLEKVLANTPQHTDSLALLKKIYIGLGMYDEAERYAQKLFEEVKSSRNLAELIKLASKTGKNEKITEYQKSDLANDEVKCAIAQVYYEQGKINDAKKILEDIMDNEDALILLGKINFDSNNFSQAREIFAKLPQNYENPEVLNYRGLFYLEDLNFMEAIKSFSKALSLDKQNPRYAYNLGNAYFFNGWMKEAVNSYLHAICLAPDIVDYRYSLAYLYYETKSFDKCQKELDYIFEQNPQHSQAIVLNALLKLKNKDFLGAKNDLENLFPEEKSDFTITSLVAVYKELAMFESAEKLLAPLIAQNPQKAEYKCELSEILISQKKYNEALKILEEVISENENYVPAYGLAACAAFGKEDLQSTKDYAQRAISIDMNFAQGYYYLALVRQKEEDFDEAVECMKRALMYDLNNAEYYAAMAEIYRLKNDFKSALEYANEASELDNSTKYKVLYTELAALNRKNKKVDEKTCPLKK